MNAVTLCWERILATKTKTSKNEISKRVFWKTAKENF